ncbi:MAG: response regulator [Desulfuromonadaceae bacterium]|nr:response regulator [Desulfuromonadaceae bacterium]MDD2847723.1 response regulator [Desulfuromonadaceae bacterium]MDD4131031.1 response regulator [Desulfuromonadaceae bacterium]
MTSTDKRPGERTRLEAAEQALHDIKVRLNKTQEIAHLGCWELNTLTGQLFWSDEVYRIFGMLPQEFAATYEAFIDSVHPDDRDLVNSAYTSSIQEDKDGYEIEHRIVRKQSGAIRYVREKCEHSRDAAGKIIGSVGMVQDITDYKNVNDSLEQRTLQVERLAHEQQFILSIMPIGAAFLKDREILAANPAFDEIFGYESGTALGVNMMALYPDSETYEHIGKSAYPEIGGGGTHTVDSLMKKRDGSLIWCSLVGRAVNAEKPDNGSIWMFKDITARKRAEDLLLESNRLLNEAREQAESASRAKSDFLARMSHELRTPMNAIIGFTQLLEDDRDNPLSEDQQDSLHEINKAGNHLLELINEVLDLARIENGRQSLSIEPLEPWEICSECVSLLRPLAQERGIAVTIIPAAAGRVVADRTKLRQVLINLISNAIKFNHESGTVAVGFELRPERLLRIWVRDSGPGITPDFLPRLFLPFERAAAVDGMVEGTGIGLVLAKRLVEAMGGAIGVETSVDNGSLFWVELPHTGQMEELEASTTAATVPLPVPSARGRRILYIEDNPANMRLVKKIVSGLGGVNLISVETAEAGLDLLRTVTPDLILLDINLPGMDGFEAFGRLRANQQTRDIPVIAVTASAMPDQVKRIIAAGFDECLTKPINVQRFVKVISMQLEKVAPGEEA